MSGKHTPGKLYVTLDDGVYGGRMIIADGRGPCIAEVMYADAQANARRLVACWNACAAIPTASLEDGAADILAHSIDLMKQRDELLSELRNIANANPKNWDWPLNDSESFQAWAQSRAGMAVAKFGGGT